MFEGTKNLKVYKLNGEILSEELKVTRYFNSRIKIMIYDIKLCKTI